MAPRSESHQKFVPQQILHIGKLCRPELIVVPGYSQVLLQHCGRCNSTYTLHLGSRVLHHYLSGILSQSHSPCMNTGGTQKIYIHELTIQKALDIARNTYDPLNRIINHFLEHNWQQIWERLIAEPDTYLLTKDEFALFNFYRNKVSSHSLIVAAVGRFWDSYSFQA